MIILRTLTLTAAFFVCFYNPVFAQPEPPLAWVKTIDNSGSLGIKTGLTTFDDSGNLYVSGTLDANITLTIDGHSVTTPAPLGGGFIAKYDPDGNCLWLKAIPFVVQISDNSNPHKFFYNNDKLYLFVCYRQNGIVMDGFSLPPCQNTFAGDLVLIQMNVTNGMAEWIRTITRPGSYSPIIPDNFEIYADQENNIHALGTASNTFIFDNGDTLISSGNTMNVDAFHAVYDTLGNIKSAHTLGVNNTNPGNYSYEYFYMDNHKHVYRFVKDTKTFIKYNEQGDILFTKTFTSGAAITGMTVDPWQNVFLSGYFSSSTMSFDGLSTSKTGGTTDAILIKFNSNNGTVEWLKNLGDPMCDRFDFINSDAIGNIYTLNNQYGNCATPGASLLVKHNNNGDIIWQKNVNTHPGGNPALFPQVRAGNISLSPDGGTIILTGNSQFSSTDKKDFTAQYGMCNTPQPVITVSNTQFCERDSAMLSITTTTPGYRYLWSNGDTTNTTIYVNTSGQYSVIAIQDEECYAESQVIGITKSPIPDTTVSINGITLTAVSGYTYQWLDCNNNHTPVNGANGSSFTPEQNGMYAVRVTSSEGCTDTSACYLVNTVGLENVTNSYIAVFPNPATGEITIQGNSKIKIVELLDLQGKQVLTATSNKIDISSLATGIYVVDVVLMNGGRWKSKVVKK